MADADETRAGVAGIWRRLQQRLVPLLGLVAVIAITVGLFLYGRDTSRIIAFKNYQYLGAFLISLIGNATILLPGIVLPILSGLGVLFYQTDGLVGPLLVGLSGSVGAAIGEMVGYLAGFSGRKILVGNRRYRQIMGQVERWGGLAIFVLALVPLFFDLVGIAAGALRFPLWKFLLFCWLGRAVLYVTAVTLAAMGLNSVFPVFP
ncbi:MAG: VTT domain-containing protein [Chloroflexota bacterium]